MNTQELRREIVEKINQISEVEVLNSISSLLNMSNVNLSKFLTFANEKIQGEHFSETEDFSGYIKEWVKSM